jgi:predicted RNase H-like nuclease (RuvC/YqgF family)
MSDKKKKDDWNGVERRDNSQIYMWLDSFGKSLRIDIKETIKEVRLDVTELKEKVGCIDKNLGIYESELDRHKKAIYGNGNPGLERKIERTVNEVTQLRTKYATTITIVGLLSGVLGWLVPTIIFYFIK